MLRIISTSPRFTPMKLKHQNIDTRDYNFPFEKYVCVKNVPHFEGQIF